MPASIVTPKEFGACGCHTRQVGSPVIIRTRRLDRVLLGTPGVNRTRDTWFRKPLLYPLSYRGGPIYSKFNFAYMADPSSDQRNDL